MRLVHALAALTVVAILSGCGDDSELSPDASGAGDAGPTCEQWMQRDVTADEVTNGCSVLTSDDPVAYEQMGTTVTTCEDRRTLYWNDAGWGYVGQPMTAHEPGDELVAPELNRTGCSADGSEPVPRVWIFPNAGNGEQAGLGGTLAYDPEIDCFFMEESGEAIVWPEGTVGTADGPGVVLPTGETARVGDRISGGGGHHPGSAASQYGIASECVTEELTVFQFEEIAVEPR